MDYTEYEPVNTAYEVKYTHYLSILRKHLSKKIRKEKWKQASTLKQGNFLNGIYKKIVRREGIEPINRASK